MKQQGVTQRFSLGGVSEQAKRYRAARAWADLDQADLARELGVDRQTVIRRESGEQNAKTAELIAVAHVCGVPAAFMLHGFTDEVIAGSDGVPLGQRLEVIERQLGELYEAGVERDLEDAQTQQQDVETSTGAGGDPDAQTEGGEA